MGERYAGVGRAADSRRDAGHHRKIDSRPCERLEFFAAAAEDEGVAALEPHHAPSLPSVLDQQVVDRRLARILTARGLADADPRRIAPSKVQHFARYQAVVQ